MQNNNKAFVSIIAIALIIGGGYFLVEQPKESVQAIRIGAILPFTGKAATYAESAQKGMEIAKEQFIATHPSEQLAVLYEDSEFTAKGGVNAFTKLFASPLPPRIIISGTSPVSIALMPLTKEKQILQMAVFASTDDYTTPDDLMFRISPRNEIEAAALAQYIQQKNYSRLAHLFTQNDQGVSFDKKLREELHKAGATTQIVAAEGFQPENNDFRTQLLKIKEQKPDAIFVIGTAKHYAPIFRQANELQIHAPFLTSRTAEDPIVLSAPKEITEQLVYTYPYDPQMPGDVAQKFVDAYQKKYGALPDTFAAEGYESLRLMLLAGHECKEDTTCMKKYLETLQGYDSVFGKLSFDKNGDVFYPMFLKTVRDGKFVRLGHISK